MLEIDNLVAGYGKVQVLHGISLKVQKGQLVTLIGSNGAGKTTTMRAVSGMIRPECRPHRSERREHRGAQAAPDHAARPGAFAGRPPRVRRRSP